MARSRNIGQDTAVAPQGRPRIKSRLTVISFVFTGSLVGIMVGRIPLRMGMLGSVT